MSRRSEIPSDALAREITIRRVEGGFVLRTEYHWETGPPDPNNYDRIPTKTATLEYVAEDSGRLAEIVQEQAAEFDA